MLFFIHLVVFAPTHVNSAFTKDLTFHVNAVFANQSLTTHASGNSTGTGPLAVILRV